MKCLNCGTVILKTGTQIKDGTSLLATGEARKIKYESQRRFARCPNCKAKNYLGDVPNDKITWIQERFVSFDFD